MAHPDQMPTPLPGQRGAFAPDRPSADEAAHAAVTIFEHLPKMHADFITQTSLHAATLALSDEAKAEIQAAMRVLSLRYRTTGGQ